MKVCWIASYPRSGNTWMRLLLHDVLFGPIESTSELQKHIPDLHRKRDCVHSEVTRSPALFKSHFLWSQSHPMSSKTAGFIYLVRNPRDVLLSTMNYVELVDSGVQDRAEFVREFTRFGGFPLWGRNGFGTWSEHARSWRCGARYPNVIVRYEDLRADPAAQLTRVLSFLGEEVHPEKIRGAVERNRLEILQQTESREKEKGDCWFPGSSKQAEQGKRFFNNGESGQRLDTIAQGLDEAFDERFAKEMARFGYLSPVDDAAVQGVSGHVEAEAGTPQGRVAC